MGLIFRKTVNLAVPSRHFSKARIACHGLLPISWNCRQYGVLRSYYHLYSSYVRSKVWLWRTFSATVHESFTSSPGRCVSSYKSLPRPLCASNQHSHHYIVTNEQASQDWRYLGHVHWPHASSFSPQCTLARLTRYSACACSAATLYYRATALSDIDPAWDQVTPIALG